MSTRLFKCNVIESSRIVDYNIAAIYLFPRIAGEVYTFHTKLRNHHFLVRRGSPVVCAVFLRPEIVRCGKSHCNTYRISLSSLIVSVDIIQISFKRSVLKRLIEIS